MAEKEYNEWFRDIQALYKNSMDLYNSVNIDDKKESLKKFEAETIKDNFWQDKERFADINQKISRLKKKLEPWDYFVTTSQDTIELMEMALAENDTEILEESCNIISTLHVKFSELETMELLSEADDLNNAFISIHPGAGGTESQDWAEMLMRMYTRWAEKHDFKVDIIDYTPGDEAGLKGATLLIKGDYSFGLMKGEMGVHRLVRISPFDSNSRRHTSFASVEVVPEINDDIDIEINEADLRIDTYRASGAGGQHVNKTDSAIRITHLPSGIVVQCQNERSQHKNKSFAMKVLKARLHEREKKQLEEKKLEKIGEKKDISWGNQIRSYVFQPYTMVKDHRTNEETGSVDYVFDGDIDKFIYAYLKLIKTA